MSQKLSASMQRSMPSSCIKRFNWRWWWRWCCGQKWYNIYLNNAVKYYKVLNSAAWFKSLHQESKYIIITNLLSNIFLENFRLFSNWKKQSFKLNTYLSKSAKYQWCHYDNLSILVFLHLCVVRDFLKTFAQIKHGLLNSSQCRW